MKKFNFTFGESYFPTYEWEWEEMTSMERGLCTKWQKEEKEKLLKATCTVVPSCARSNDTANTTFGTVLGEISQLPEVQEFKKMAFWKHSGNESKEKEFSIKKITACPAFTLSTYTNKGESLKDLGDEPRNEYIIIDVDFDKPEDITKEAFDKLNSLPFVIGSASSISGLGFWSIVKVNIESIHSREEWQMMYRELYEYYKERGITIDKSCCNINRLRVISPYDFIYNKKFINQYEPKLKEEEKENKSEKVNRNYEISLLGRAFKEPYISGDNHYRRLEWASTIVALMGEQGKDLYYNIFSEDIRKDNDLDVTWNWCCKNKENCRTSQYCLSKLIKFGWAKGQAENNEEEDYTKESPLYDF